MDRIYYDRPACGFLHIDGLPFPRISIFMIPNSFIVDRHCHEKITSSRILSKNSVSVIPLRILYHIDCYIIEEPDGSASFLKNKHNNKMYMSPDEYQEFKNSFSNDTKIKTSSIDAFDALKSFK